MPLPKIKKRKVEHQEHQEQQVRGRQTSPNQEQQVRSQQVRGRQTSPNQEQQVRSQQVRGRQTSSNQEIPASAKLIEKLINQNFKILSKLDILISAQQSIDDRLKKIEGSSDESSSEDIIKTIIVEIARNLLKVSIYPSQDEFRDEIEKVLKNSFPEFYKKFCQNQFFIFYEKNIYQRLIAKHRSYRGSLTSRIKDALHHIFPELPSITSNSPPSEIRQWKNNPIVANCHNKLFKKIVVEEPTTFMSKILDRLFPLKKSAPKIYVAYAISVCEYLLNPSNQQIQVSESAIKFLISKYLQKVLNKEKFVSSDEDEAVTTSKTAVMCTWSHFTFNSI